MRSVLRLDRHLAAALALLALAACGRAQSEREAREPEVDPAVARALMAPLLADPDLIAFGQASDAGFLDATIPPDDFAASTVSAARAEARRLTQGARPSDVAASGDCPGCDALFLDQRARLLGDDCRGRLNPDLEWSLRLPADLPIYPKSHLREGAGGDDPSCAARAASFTAPVPADEVLGFYRAVAVRAGYRLTSAGPRAFNGRRGGQRMAVIVRSGADGYSQFDLITAG